MVYRLYVETVTQDDKIAYAYTFYNHQDFMVYKHVGISTYAQNKNAILEASVIALTYFERSIRRRYYDEHFSTRIDEDYVTLYTEFPKISEVASIYKTDEAASIGYIGDDKELWEALVPFFTQKTMMFETATEEKFINVAKELAQTAFTK
ncbi:MAG: hypothetical protein E7598_02960 [Ruminococcaceae bacterium]|nr:hypothetical protein [Oscillospiraceae bacterium]